MDAAAPAVLLVEDDDLLRDAFRVLLADAGYTVLEAATGQEALDAARQRAPAVVFLDLGLPDRPGLDIARALREDPATADAPIIALTGRGGTQDRTASLEAGCTDFLEKPVRPTTLLRHVRRLLG